MHGASSFEDSRKEWVGWLLSPPGHKKTVRAEKQRAPLIK
jgi:hypothetical protein